jgi:serine/threonine-protein kinase MRCK
MMLYMLSVVGENTSILRISNGFLELSSSLIEIPEIGRVGDVKRVWQLEYIEKEQVLVAIAGRQHQVRLIPIRALDAGPTEVEWLKVADTKNCNLLSTGVMKTGPPHPTYCFCVAVKRQVLIYEINRTKSRHKKVREFTLPAVAQCLVVMSQGRLCVGYQSGFSIYSLYGDQHPVGKWLFFFSCSSRSCL